jgi:hypothetical protein
MRLLEAPGLRSGTCLVPSPLGRVALLISLIEFPSLQPSKHIFFVVINKHPDISEAVKSLLVIDCLRSSQLCITSEEQEYIESHLEVSDSNDTSAAANFSHPSSSSSTVSRHSPAKAAAQSWGLRVWLLLLRSPACWAAFAAHFAHNWGLYVGLSWVPTYFQDGTIQLVLLACHYCACCGLFLQGLSYWPPCLIVP